MKSGLRVGLIAVTCVLLLSFSALANAGDLTDNGFRIIVAGIPCNLMTGYEKAYTETFRDCRLVAFQDTTQKGITRFIEGDADLMVTARKMTKSEAMKAGKNGITPEPKLIGKISLAIITDAKNPIEEITLVQLKKIFSGEIVNWRQVGGRDQPIKVVSEAVPQTGTGPAFQKAVLDDASYAKSASQITSCFSMMDQCSKPGAIGYFPTASPFFGDLKKRGIKVVAVRLAPDSEAIIPAAGVVKETAYPITMPFYFYYDAKDENPCVSKFAYFCAYLKQTACLDPNTGDE